jgi:hypothetical protein
MPALAKPAFAITSSGQSAAVFPSRTPISLNAWILFCVLCNAIGWLLSICHQLNRPGYAIGFAICIALILFFHRQLFPFSVPTARLSKYKRRFKRLFPLGFLALATMAILGGALYPPNNYDALAYRTPRVLHWLAEGRWHWIHTEFHRLNVRGCGIEWVSAPFIAFLRTDRLLFLINAICFLFLPGRVFAILTRLGVRPRAAWYWMWLFPTGYCFLLQAGSIGNDLFGALFAMAAIELALRARESGKVSQLWFSMLAVGLMTASKTFNLVLLPAWFVAVFPSIRLLSQRWLSSGFIALLAACVSFLPTAILNFRFCGDWSGQAAEQAAAIGTGEPILHIIVNALLLLLHNFAPTLFPFADAWNQMMDRVISPSLATRLAHHFEPAGARFLLGEMQIEEMAGLGMGLSLLLFATFIHAVVVRPRAFFLASRFFRYESLVSFAAWGGAGVLMATSGLNCPGRYFAPFYVVLLAPLLTASSIVDGNALRTKWFRIGTLGVFLLSGLLLVLTQARPLWPARTILRGLGAEHSTSPILTRAYKVYSVYGGRDDAFKAVRALLPPGANPLGLITSDDPETSLWRPFGSRRVVHICSRDTPEQIRAEGIRYALISSNALRTSIDEWLTQNRAETLKEIQLELRATKGPTPWYLVEVK